MLEALNLIHLVFAALMGAGLSSLFNYFFLKKRERDSNQQKRKQVATQLYQEVESIFNRYKTVIGSEIDNSSEEKTINCDIYISSDYFAGLDTLVTQLHHLKADTAKQAFSTLILMRATKDAINANTSQFFKSREAEKLAYIMETEKHLKISEFEKTELVQRSRNLKQSQSELEKSIKGLMNTLKNTEGVRPETV